MKTLCVPKTSSKGIVMGEAFVVKRQDLTPEHYSAADSEAEIRLFDEAVDAVASQLEVLAKDNEIFAAHLEVVHDAALSEGVKEKVKSAQMNVQEALDKTAEEFITIFEMMNDEYMRERAADIKDIRNRLMTKLKGLSEASFDEISRKVILVAEDLAPSDTAKLDLNYILGFATELGGVTSHVSIMARNVGLPALVGVSGLLDCVKDGDYMIMDAGAGKLIIDPDEATIEAYCKAVKAFNEEQKAVEALAHLPAITKDGHKVKVCANVGNTQEVEAALEHYIDGVGLFRSEFLYMGNTHFPTEEEQFEIYKKAALLCNGEVIIRTLDIGGDKSLPYYEFEKEDNPFLGWRAIRICLDLDDVFKAQLRALLRASAFGNIWIMYPMMISAEELMRANKVLKDCKQELDAQGIAYNKEIKVGMMIETPASVMNAEYFAEHVDFFSIGTNDLTQYLLAVDRGNKKISAMYNSFHPAVLHAIGYVIKAGHKHGIQVGMCGEFASDAKAAKVLLGMGLDEFSVSAAEAANIKHIIRESDYAACQAMAQSVMEAYTIDEIMAIIGE